MFFIKNAEAYEGSDMNADEIWEEIICDSLGDMNIFAPVELLGEMNSTFLAELKNEIKVSQNMKRGPPANVDKAKFSIETEPINGTLFVAVEKPSISKLMQYPGDSVSAKVRSFMKQYRGTVLPLGSTDKTYMRREAEGEYTNPAKLVSEDAYTGKLNAASELRNLLKAAAFVRHNNNNGRHPDATRGWNYYKINYVVPINDSEIRAYSGEIQIKLIDRGDCFYDITKIEDITNGSAGQALIKAAGSVYDASSNSISQKSDLSTESEKKVSTGKASRELNVDSAHTKITANMTEEARYKALKKRSINIPPVAELSDSILKKVPEISSWDEINNHLGSTKRKIIHKLAVEFGTVGKEYANDDIQLSFVFSNNNFNETYKKQQKNYATFAKIFSVFDTVVKNAIGIEIHNRTDYKPDPTLDNVFVLISAYQDGEFIIPVKLEVKKFKDKQNTLYVAISLEKIKKTEVLGRGNTENGVTQQPRSVNISIAEIFKKINPSDKNFLKYIPDGFLDEKQKAAKAEALLEDKNNDIRFSRELDVEGMASTNASKPKLSNRAILANALEKVAQNDIERKRLREYQADIAKIDELEEHLAEVNAEIKALSFTKGADRSKLSALYDDKVKTTNRITTYDRRLLSLEANEALKNLLTREKQKAYKKAAQEGREAISSYRNQRTKTELRHKIKKVVNELNQYLLNGTKEHRERFSVSAKACNKKSPIAVSQVYKPAGTIDD